MWGLLNIDKPYDVTSRDVVNHVQRLVRPHRAGHAGTLDPLATGVFVVCVGAATRLIEFVQDRPKTYLATFLLGRSSETEDIESPLVVLEDPPDSHASTRCRRCCRGFCGEILQRPPAYSALKVQGRRAYALARRGQAVELAPRPVTIFRLEIVRYAYPELVLNVQCGSGTYMRSLGRDIAAGPGHRGRHVGVAADGDRELLGRHGVHARTTHGADLARFSVARQPGGGALAGAVPEQPGDGRDWHTVARFAARFLTRRPTRPLWMRRGPCSAFFARCDRVNCSRIAISWCPDAPLAVGGRCGTFVRHGPRWRRIRARWWVVTRPERGVRAKLPIGEVARGWGSRTRMQLLRFCLPRAEFSSFPSGKRCHRRRRKLAAGQRASRSM